MRQNLVIRWVNSHHVLMLLLSALEQDSLCCVDKWGLDSCIFLLGFCYGFSWDVYLHVAFIGFSTQITQSKCCGLCSCANQKKCLSLFHFFLSSMEVRGRICQNVTLFHQDLLPYTGSCMITGFFMASLWVVCVACSPPLPWTYTHPLKNAIETSVLRLRQLYNQKEGPSWSTINFYKSIWIKLLYKYLSYHQLFSTTQKMAFFFL